MADLGPWSHPLFNTENYRGWIMLLDPRQLRMKAISQGLLPDLGQQLAVKDRERDGRAEHNEYLLEIIMPRGKASFEKFLIILSEMNYPEKRVLFERLLIPPAHETSDGEAKTDDFVSATASSQEWKSGEGIAAADVVRITRGGHDFSTTSVRKIKDVSTVGKAMGQCMDDQHCVDLAHAFVEWRGGYVNNFRSIVTPFIKDHDCGKAEVTNVAGLLFYLRAGDKDAMLADLLSMVKKVSPPLVSDVEEILRKASFK